MTDTKRPLDQKVSIAVQPKLLLATGLSALLAMGVHGYLYSQHLDLKFGTMVGKSICDLNDTFSCSAVAASKYSEVFGIPIALLGFFANLAVLVLLAMWPFTEDEKRPIARRNLLIATGGIAAVSIVMGTISTIAIGKLCLFCISAYILSFIALGGVVFGIPAHKSRALPATPLNPGHFVSLIVLGFIALIGSLIVNDNMERSSGFEKMDTTVQGFLREWQSGPTRSFATVDALATGPDAAHARMTLVEFADYRCIHCKHASPVFKAFSASHPDVRFEFEPWPLDGECNTAIEGNANGASCLLGRIVWCVEKANGKGWSAHDFIYDAPEIYPTVDAVRTALPEIAKSCELDPEKLRACADSDEAKDTIRKMAAVGTGLGLRGTPTVYANGKQLPGGQVLPVLQGAYALSPTK